MALQAMRARARRGISSFDGIALGESLHDREGRAGRAPMNRGAAIGLAPARLVPGRMPDQPGAGSQCFATGCITGR